MLHTAAEPFLAGTQPYIILVSKHEPSRYSCVVAVIFIMRSTAERTKANIATSANVVLWSQVFEFTLSKHLQAVTVDKRMKKSTRAKMQCYSHQAGEIPNGAALNHPTMLPVLLYAGAASAVCVLCGYVFGPAPCILWPVPQHQHITVSGSRCTRQPAS